MAGLFCLITIARTYGQYNKIHYGQVAVEIIKEKKPGKIYSMVDITQPFPGGDSLWTKAVEKAIDHSIRHYKSIKQGKYFVSVYFIVMNCCLSDFIVSKDSDSRISRKVVEVLKLRKYQEKWQPCNCIAKGQ